MPNSPTSNSETSEEMVTNLISDLWLSTLNIQEIDVDSTIFAYGADSISIGEMIDKIEEALALTCSFSDFYNHSTIRSFSKKIKYDMDKNQIKI